MQSRHQKADNLITDDSNYIAVITRENIIGDVVPTRIVRSGSGNTLPDSAPEFTTLATVYEINLRVEEAYIGRKPDLTVLPRPGDKALAIQNLEDFWKKFIEFEAYLHSLADPTEGGDDRRKEIRKGSVACKPIVQRVLAEVILELQCGADGEEMLDPEETVSRLNTLDWSPENPLWQGILLNGNKVIAGASPLKLASRMIAYMLGQSLEALEVKKLEEAFKENNPDREFRIGLSKGFAYHR